MAELIAVLIVSLVSGFAGGLLGAILVAWYSITITRQESNDGK